MKRFFALCAVVSLAIGVTLAQNEKTAVGDQIATQITRLSTVTTLTPAVEGVSFQNMVCVRAFHKGAALPFYTECNHNLKTTAGIDWVAGELGAGTAGTMTYIALSTDATTPAAGDCATTTCTLTSEISTNGLGRHVATYSHSTGTNTFTQSYTWTASGTQANVQKAAIFSAVSGGYFAFENTFTPVSLNTNDQLQVTWTITIS